MTTTATGRAFKLFLTWSLLVLLAGIGSTLSAAPIPPPPPTYFKDYAGVVKSETSANLTRQLEDFERQTSIQLLTVIFKDMGDELSMEDYTHRIFEHWKPGQAKTNNGAILFVFVKEHKIRIEVGYGLESVLPDSLASAIISNDITPAFKRGDYDAGLTAGVAAMIQATKGEYKGTNKTINDTKRKSKNRTPSLFFIILIVFIIFSRSRRGRLYDRRGGSFWWGFPAGLGGGSWGGGGGGSSGGGFSGGGFSGGGGSSGGGGASGGW
ncbi:MAG: hypothetical protein JWM04_2721 [Verrucomicrobiales bacterium]|nr:hypothetical protein [Verrucomicrobiales bacterium]